jgi:hypothetical protein
MLRGVQRPPEMMQGTCLDSFCAWNQVLILLPVICFSASVRMADSPKHRKM